jgi:hypothetical protein
MIDTGQKPEPAAGVQKPSPVMLVEQDKSINISGQPRTAEKRSGDSTDDQTQYVL